MNGEIEGAKHLKDVEKEYHGTTKIYRRAIIHALEESRDFQSRSNLDSIRRYTASILNDQNLENHNFKWNDAIFLRTVKSMADNGDIDLCSNILAELSPSYKRKRADSLAQRMSIEFEPTTTIESRNMTSTNPVVPDSTMIEKPRFIKRSAPKEAPHRPIEHDKWKIIPKKIYDKADFD